MTPFESGARPRRREWWQTGNALFFGLLALPTMAFAAWGTVFVARGALQGQGSLISPLVFMMVAIVQALMFLIGLLLLFAAASQWQVERQAEWERRMGSVWVPIYLLIFAMLGVLGAMWPSPLGLGLVAVLGAFIWWERPDEVRAWLARRLYAR